MKLLDTNVLLRLLLEDDAAQTQAVEHFIRRAFARHEKLFVPDLVFAEMVWVMESQGVARRIIAALTRTIASDPKLTLDNRDTMLSALALYEEHDVDFAEAFFTALVLDRGLESLVSFDKHAGKLPVKWEVP